MTLTALNLAKKLRAGETLAFLDSLLWFDGSRFVESRMYLNVSADGHSFLQSFPKASKVRHWLKSGAYH